MPLLPLPHQGGGGLQRHCWLIPEQETHTLLLAMNTHTLLLATLCCSPLLLSGEEAQDRSDVEDLQRFAADLVRATRQYLDAIYTPMQVQGG